MRQAVYTNAIAVEGGNVMAAEYNVIGRSPQRRDARDKVTGRAKFTCDVFLPGMLYARVLRSPYPHARIKSIDITRAQALHGVRAVLCHKNTIDTLYNSAASMMAVPAGHEIVLDQRIFDSVVRYVGDEVAAVAADTPEIAEEALSLIQVEYEPLPFVLDPLEAEKPDAVAIHPDKPHLQSAHNVPGHPNHIDKGNIEQGFKDADEIVEMQFKLRPVKQMQMETMGAVAQVDGSGKITVWSTTQTTHVARGQIAHVFQVPASQVRVQNPPYVGGGFGSRIGLSAKAELIAVALAKEAGRPVKFIYSRTEDMVASDTRHGGYLWLKLGAKRDGTLTAMDLKAVLNKGAYCSFGGEIYGTLGIMNLVRYRIPNLRFVGYSVYTNTSTAGAFRGFGNPQGNVTVERGIDMMAKRLGIDPLEFRLKNATQKGDDTVFPYPVDSSTLHECMRRGAARIGWEKRSVYNAQKGTLRRGMGMAFGTHFSNSWPYIVDYENAYITVQPDGSVNAITAATDLGTGNNTALAQMAAEALGAQFASVHLTFGDTDSTPFGYGAHSSRSVFAHGSALVAAAEECRKQIFTFAGQLCNRPADSFELRDGVLRAKDGASCFPAEVRQRHIFPGMPVSQQAEGTVDWVSLTDIAHYAHSQNQCFIGVGQVKLTNAPPWHCVFADVTVDTETGRVTINKMVAAHDVGRVIHPDNLEGQILGGVTQGIGYALTEELGYDPGSGRQTHTTMHHYMLPTAMDVPPIEPLTVEEDDPHGPFGAKGAGETSLVSPAAAIVNAVSNALDIDFNEMPLTPERILMRLHTEEAK